MKSPANGIKEESAWQMSKAIKMMISISEKELASFFGFCRSELFAAKAVLSRHEEVSESIFFICKGITRSLLVDHLGNEHTIHFSLENQFVCDYASFLTKTPASNSIQALEETEVVIIPRSAIEWGYQNLNEGDRLGRLIAEYYFIYFDARLKNAYFNSPAERYENITHVFPNIHNRVPQHMIASYLGITPVHLSRLKKSSR